MKFCLEKIAEGVLGGSAYDSRNAVYDTGTTDWLKRIESFDCDLRVKIDQADASNEIKGAFYAYVMNKMPLKAIAEALQIEQSKLFKMMQTVFDQLTRIENL